MNRLLSNKVVRDYVERAWTAAVIGAAVAYEAGARDYKVLAGAGLAALLSFVKNSAKAGVSAAKDAAPAKPVTPVGPANV